MHKLSEQIERKFVDTVNTNEWEIETDSGWQPLSCVSQTVPYEKWVLQLEDCSLEAADTHIVFDENMQEIFLKDIQVGQQIQTKSGLQTAQFINATSTIENMYDITVDSNDHRFYSNNILSHNSVTAAGYLLWSAMFTRDCGILIAAHKWDGAKEIMDRIRFGYELCPDHIRAGVTDYNKRSIFFENGSRIEAQTTTPTTGRGKSISIMYLDEFAFVRTTIQKEFWTSISPALSSGGKTIITSTPNSDEDQFSDLWKNANKCIDEFGNPTETGRNGFKSFKAYWYQHPERDEAWAAEERAKVGEEQFEREFNLEFLIAEETLIDSRKLLYLEGKEPIERQGAVRWYARPKKNSMYFVALDPSLGTGYDPAAIQVFEGPHLKQIAEWQHNKTPIQQQVNILADIVKYLSEVSGSSLNNVYYSVENNTIGEAALNAIADKGEENIPGIFISEPARLGSTKRYRKGLNTTNSKKVAACSKLKTLVENDKIELNSKNLISELKSFVASGVGFKAKPGDTDDLVTALLTVIRMAEVMKNYHSDLYETMTNTFEAADLPMPFISMIR